MAAVANYHKLHNLKHHTDLLSHCSTGQEPDIGLKGLKSRCRKHCVLFWRLQGESVSSSFLTSRGSCLPWLLAVFPLIKCRHSRLSPSHIVSLWPLFPLLPSKDACDRSGILIQVCLHKVHFLYMLVILTILCPFRLADIGYFIFKVVIIVLVLGI